MPVQDGIDVGDTNVLDRGQIDGVELEGGGLDAARFDVILDVFGNAARTGSRSPSRRFCGSMGASSHLAELA